MVGKEINHFEATRVRVSNLIFQTMSLRLSFWKRGQGEITWTISW
jgi:hypothetical protein